MNEKFLKPYNPKSTEDSIYARWEESGFFNPDICLKKGVCSSDSETFSIVLPPPNVTGVLHLGHAFEDTLQDIFVRYARMRGRRVLWIPGTDSAAIATQARVEKDLYKKEKKTRHDVGRDELVVHVEKYAKESEGTIIKQIKKMGASLDWSRYAYTLDEKRTTAVTEAFVRMYNAGLIYRGNRIINWDPKGQTTISDDEVVYERRRTTLYTFRYWKDFPFPIATTRPETKVGDTAVAVHPKDKRYSKYIGKTLTGEFAGTMLNITVVGDESVEKDFGTGALGVTPAHSQTDWDIADRHNLPRPKVIDESARMTENAGALVAGLKTTEAREKIVTWLSENNLLENQEEIDQNVAIAERTGGIIEPLPKLQWFIDVNKKFSLSHSEIHEIDSSKEISLKEIMYTAVSEGEIEMWPERFRKSYFHWVENLHDWCISRQIWFGHRIPVWYRKDEIYCGTTPPKDSGWEQDPDVLDTWFSSALWTFSTLGWPDKTDDLKVYHPTDFMLPGYEILFLWVSRMILMSGFLLGQVPFRKVMLHGIVRDKKGRKFSKSLGNGVDPLEIIDKFGADALRMGMIVGASPGSDIRFDEDKVKGYKHFANKLWNITRFILSNLKSESLAKDISLLENDMKIEKEVRAVASEMNGYFEKYRIDLAAEKIYRFTWHRLADEILEESKPILSGEDENARQSRQRLLYNTLIVVLKLLHPFMPFVTEEIWKDLPEKDTDLLMAAPFPTT